MNEFQSEGCGLRKSARPLLKVKTEVTPELQKQIDELREVWNRTIHRGGGGGGPKCECGKDKHGFAFHMRFCPKWEPIC